MHKKTEDVAAGDWVLLESLFLNRRTGKPCQVSKVSNSRVYVQEFRVNSKTNERYVLNEKYVNRKAVLYAFTTEETARVAYDLVETQHQEHTRVLEELQKKQDVEFNALMLRLSAAVSVGPGPA